MNATILYWIFSIFLKQIELKNVYQHYVFGRWLLERQMGRKPNRVSQARAESVINQWKLSNYSHSLFNQGFFKISGQQLGQAGSERKDQRKDLLSFLRQSGWHEMVYAHVSLNMKIYQK